MESGRPRRGPGGLTVRLPVPCQFADSIIAVNARMTDSSPPQPASVPLPRSSARWSAAITALLVLAIVGALPALRDVSEHLQAAASSGLPRWSVLVLATAALQAAYAVYLAQFRQRAAVYVVAWFLLAVAMGYASLLGWSLLAGESSRPLAWLGLTTSRAALRGWCFLMTSATSVSVLLVRRAADPAPRPQ